MGPASSSKRVPPCPSSEASVHLRPSSCRVALLLLWLTASPAVLGAQRPATAPPPQPGKAAPQSDLDAFMEKVLARREVNRKMLNQYVLDETETFEALGPGQWPMYRSKRDFTWYERDGMHVRSPVRFNGVAVNEQERRQYEDTWMKREKERAERRAKNQKEKGEIVVGSNGVEINGTAMPTEPRFVSEAYFMDFKFEPGNYYLAGREKLEGHDVLRIEYYPTNLFNDEDDEKTPHEMKGRKKSKDQQKEDKAEEEINRKMNKTAMVTLWVDPAEHQIVKYTFDNVWMDFLPAGWLVRVDDIRASMTMGQPFPGVWLPRNMNIHAGLTLALGSYEASYGRVFSDYREAEVKTTIKVPKLSSARVPGPDADVVRLKADATGEHGPFVPDQEQQPATETIREIRVHGNAAVTDADVLQLAGVAVGDPLTPDSLNLVEKRLKDSGKFETIEVRKRYRSIDDPTDVALVLVVHERAGVVSSTTAGGGPGRITRPWHRAFTDRLMFFPVLNYEDGYGFTYGARFSTIDLLGLGERLSTPLTWGGTKRAALEFERSFKTGPVTRVFSSFGIWNRENPRFEIDDQRVELKGRVERQFAHLVRVGFDGSRSSVSFGTLDDQIWTIGTNAVFDTRGDPAFPGNAVLLGAGWSQLNVRGHDAINRYNTDARGYLRVIRQVVLAGRAQYFTSDGTLPPYERLLLGGSSSLRGFETGAFDGDRMIVTSAELRVPLTSVLSGAKLGVDAFTDVSKAVNFDQRLGDAPWHQGVGAGVFLIAPLLKINLDVGHGLKDGNTRVILSTGFNF